MTPRGRDGSRIGRTVTSCASCLAWGLTYSQGICLDCYNFAAPRMRRPVAECGACTRPQLLKGGYCRLCWCQAREDRMLFTDARSAVTIAPHLPNVGSQQLFLAGMHHKRQPKQPAIPRRYGVKGRPLKPPPAPVFQPRTRWRQPPLIDDLIPRVYVYGRFDLRTGPAPDNPWLAWALHIAHTTAEARGWSSIVRRGMQRTLVMLLAGHIHGDDVRVSDFEHVARYTNVDHVVEILATMGVAQDDRPRTFDLWLDAKVGALPDAIRRDATGWAQSLHDGGPRTHARRPSTAYGYVRAVQPALLAWAGRYGHLREVTRDDIGVYLDTRQGRARETAHAALRSLFGWAKRNKLIFRNPVSRAGSTPTARPPLAAAEPGRRCPHHRRGHHRAGQSLRRPRRSTRGASRPHPRHAAG
jgi:hypothetical protein